MSQIAEIDPYTKYLGQYLEGFLRVKNDAEAREHLREEAIGKCPAEFKERFMDDCAGMEVLIQYGKEVDWSDVIASLPKPPPTPST